MSILVTIIITVYNGMEYIDRCIKSVIDQTYKNLEILLVDNNSTDGSALICDDWATKDKRIHVIHNTADTSDIRNIGLMSATGDYIEFVNVEDWLAPDMCFFLLSNSIKYNADVVYCSYYKANSEMDYTQCSESKGETIISDNKDGMYDYLTKKYFMLLTFNKLYKKQILTDLYFEEDVSVNSDELFNFWAFKRTPRSVFLGVPKYFKFTKPEELTEKNELQKIAFANLEFSKKMSDLINLFYSEFKTLFEKKDIENTINFAFELYTFDNTIIENNKYKEIINKLKKRLKLVVINSDLTLKYKFLLLLIRVNKSIFLKVASLCLN